MDIQINDISEPVIQKAGEALYFAQRLENSLITHLLVRKKISEKVISTAMIHEIEARVRGDKLTLGALIAELNCELGGLASKEWTPIQAALMSFGCCCIS